MRENSHLSDKEINILKDKLLAKKEEILNSDSSGEKYCLDTNELSDPLDEASANIQAAQELRFRNRDLFLLKKIDKSLKMIDEGIYGLCKECDIPIEFRRLTARITAELCLKCKEDSEFEEKHNFHKRKSKSIGKTLQDLGPRA